MTYAEEKIALAELVEKVAAETKVALTAHVDVADEPLAIYVKDMPARELLEQVAELFDYRWSRRATATTGARKNGDADRGRWPVVGVAPPRYEIWQDVASKQREEALAARAPGRRACGGCAPNWPSMWRWRALPEGEIHALAAGAEARERIRQLLRPDGQGASATPFAGGGALYQRGLLARRLDSAITRALALLLGEMTPDQWDTVAKKGLLNFSTTPVFGEESPCRGHRGHPALRPAHPAASGAGRIPTRPPSIARPWNCCGSRSASAQDQWAAATGFRAQVRLQTASGIGGAVTLTAKVLPLAERCAGRRTRRFSVTKTSSQIVALPPARWSASHTAIWKKSARGPKATRFSASAPRSPRAPRRGRRALASRELSAGDCLT